MENTQNKLMCRSRVQTNNLIDISFKKYEYICTPPPTLYLFKAFDNMKFPIFYIEFYKLIVSYLAAENPTRQLPTPTGRDPGSCYPMERPYGFALVVNIKRFENRAVNVDNKKLTERKGSDVDVKNLKDLWEQLGFEVKIYEDLKAHEIYTVVLEMARKIDRLKTSSCFVCCIMTHGNMGVIYGSDSNSLNINHIIDQFKEENCKALAAKPKLFFIQACREIKQDSKATVSTSTATPLTGSTEEGTKEGANARETESVSIVEAECDVDSDKNDSAFRHSAEPNEHHFLLGYSTAPGK